MSASGALGPPAWVLVLAVGPGCGDRAMSGDGTSGGGPESGVETQFASSESEPSEGVSAEATSNDASTTTAIDSSTGAGDGGVTGPGPDVYMPECDVPPTSLVVTSAQTPAGPMAVDMAWMGHAACYTGPYVALVQGESEDAPAREIFVRMHVEDAPAPPWMGTFPASVDFAEEPVGTFELLEPLAWSAELDDPRAEPRLRARIELHERGWDLSVEVDLVDCGTIRCFCPCE